MRPLSAGPAPSSGRGDDLRRWSAQFADATPIGEATARQPGVCVGVVHSIRLVPGKTLEITVDDGSGRLTAVFSGRNRLPGLEMGAGMRVHGTVAVDAHRRRTMLNPDWALVAEPYA